MKVFVENLIKILFIKYEKKIRIYQAKCFNLKLKKQSIKYDIQIERLKRSENKISFLRTAAKTHNGIVIK
jgi:hypothetical protein